MYILEAAVARLAQSVEHQTFNLRVAGSSPSSGVNFVVYVKTGYTLIYSNVFSITSILSRRWFQYHRLYFKHLEYGSKR